MYLVLNLIVILNPITTLEAIYRSWRHLQSDIEYLTIA